VAVFAIAPAFSGPAPSLAQDATPDFGTGAERKMIHIVPPTRGYLQPFSGRVEIQTLIIHPLITAVDFLLDGERVWRASKRPYIGHVELAEPARRQELKVRGYDALGEVIGTDRMILNQPDVPFRVRIATMRRVEANGYDAVRVGVEVSMPRSATLEQVAVYRGDRLVETVSHFGKAATPSVPRTIPVDVQMEYGSADDFIRVTATLASGRESEDAQLLQGADYQSEIDVQLVQLQLLVTDSDGNPVSGLSPGDFEIRENGRKRAAVALHTAVDVPLVLGLAIDTSNSIVPIWSQVRNVSAGFLEAALAAGDRAFVVDFAGTVRLASELTGYKLLLQSRLRSLAPRLGTALNDAILFSLLQYGREPGRRALVVVTDGVDLHSRSKPKQSADFAERLGLPIYFIELDQSDDPYAAHDPYGLAWREKRKQREASGRLRWISRRTGGRVFTIRLLVDDPPWAERIEGVFDQIEEDLRHQHVLTYYSNRPPGAPIEPEIKMTRRGRRLRSALPLDAIE
jgi:Ca-activated chloride channel family protein